MQQGRTKTSNSLFTVWQSFAFDAACFIHCFLSCFTFFPISYKPLFGLIIVYFFSPPDIQQKGDTGQSSPHTDQRQLALQADWRRKSLHTPLGTCQRQVLEESPTQLKGGNMYFLYPSYNPESISEAAETFVPLSMFLGWLSLLAVSAWFASHLNQASIQRFLSVFKKASLTVCVETIMAGQRHSVGFSQNPSSWNTKILRIWEPMTSLNFVVSTFYKLSYWFWWGIGREQELSSLEFKWVEEAIVGSLNMKGSEFSSETEDCSYSGWQARDSTQKQVYRNPSMEKKQPFLAPCWQGTVVPQPNLKSSLPRILVTSLGTGQWEFMWMRCPDCVCGERVQKRVNTISFHYWQRPG